MTNIITTDILIALIIFYRMNFKMNNHVKELRIKKRWSQNELARRANVSRQTISLIENNISLPSIIIAARISRAFSTNIENIFII